jgi:lipoprotein NlpI
MQIFMKALIAGFASLVTMVFMPTGSSAYPLAAADDSDAKTKKGEVCEANFYGGEFALLRGRKDEARHLLGLAADDCPKTFVEYYSAKAELKAFGANQ